MSILGTVATQDIFQLKDGYSVLWLGALYLLGGCIGKFGWFKKISKSKLVLIYAGSVLAAWGAKYLLELWNNPWINQFTYSEVLIRYKAPTILAASVALLLLFAKIKLPNRFNKVVKLLAPAAFGVYIIHMHPQIWNLVIVGKFSALPGEGVGWMILKVLVAVVVFYLAFSLLDHIRIALFRWLKLKERISALEEKIRNRSSEKETP